MFPTAAKLLTTFCFAGILAAQPGPGGPGRFGAPGAVPGSDRQNRQPDWTEVKAKLNLSDQQIQSLTTLQSNFLAATQAIMEQIGDKAAALRTEMERTQPNAGVAGQLLIDIKNLQAQIQTKREELNKQAVALLNDTQKAALAELQKAAALAPAIHQATALNLLLPPNREDAPGLGPLPVVGPGMMSRGSARRGLF